MSRVIVSRYPDGKEHVVVGWDHPAGGAFWQEWASREEVARAEAWLEDNGDSDKFGTDEYYLNERIAETEVKREGGMFPGIQLDKLIESMPEELQPLMLHQVMTVILRSKEDPDSGRWAPIDLSDAVKLILNLEQQHD
jgi:hypothetical protein